MQCPSCHTEIAEDLNFCPQCGAILVSDVPAEDISRSNTTEDAAPAAATVPEQDEVVKKQRSKKPLIIAAATVLIILAGVFITRAIINNMHDKAYEAARQALSDEDYETALEGFKKLGGFRDSEDQVVYCQNSIDYEAALKLLEDGDYDKARSAFEKLDGFKDAEDQVTRCYDLKQYEEAEALFAEKKYAEAKAIYISLPTDQTDDFPQAAEHLTYCENKEKYDAAAAQLKDKKYYDAYKAFSALGTFEDAKAKAESCKQPFPKTGESYRNKKYPSKAVSLTIVPPSNGQFNYLKIYTGNDLVSCVALGKNQKATVSLPVGTYTIKDAFSTGAWFGATDMFGDTGTYVKLTNGSSESFKLDANTIYTLTLRSGSGSGASVGSEGEDRASF